jgi:hypothetical protein
MITTSEDRKKINPMLAKVLLISGGLHLAALLVLGSYTLVKYVIPDDTQFEEPPAIKEEAPPVEQKVEIQPQTTPLNQSLQRLNMKQVGNISVASVDVNIPGMEGSFTVSSGLGNFSGGSIMSGSNRSLNIGMSSVNVFGLKTRAEKILFVIDANRQMVTDKKGGLNSYKVIKDEITDMVGNLSSGTLFNVMLQDRRRILAFKPQIVPAGTEVHSELISWFKNINSSASQVGLEGNSAASKPNITKLLPETGNVIYDTLDYLGGNDNEIAFVTQYALEQSVDAIFFISGSHNGFDRIRRPLNEREQADWIKTKNDPKYIEQLKMHEAEKPLMQKRIDRAMAEINEDRKKKGLPPRILEQRFGMYSNAQELNIEWETKHPGFLPAYRVEKREVERYFEDIVEVLYVDKGFEPPSINVILFLAGDEELGQRAENNLDDYVDQFNGDYRVIRGSDQIQSARTAKETTN